jgi:hypothetical protein
MFAEELTIVQIIESLEKNIFSTNIDSEFDLKCLEREHGIKEAINMCMEQMMELAKTPGLEKLTARQKIKSKNCIENLSKYVKELINELDEEKIKSHINEIENNKNQFIIRLHKPFELDMTFLWSNSFYTAITTEILWAPRVTVTQAMDISRGKLDLDDLGRHLPEIIKELKTNVIPYLKSSKIYNEFSESLKEALDCYSKKYFRGCNLIIMTSIEGMVRKLSNFLAPHHELGDDFSDDKYKSLSSLLREVKWKKDFKIDSTTLSLLVGENKTINERRFDIKNGLRDFEIIDLNTRLDFLKGRFKDDRDMILHGSYIDYNKKWNLFLNFSALIETKKVCEYYDKKYVS